MHYDVIVIGAGSVGMAAGYYLAKSGKNVLLIDAFDPPHQSGSHHGETRIIRYAYGEGAEYVPLVLEAKKLWEDLAEASDRKIFMQTGVLNVGEPDSDFIRSTISSANDYALPLEVMRAETIQRRWPGLTIPKYFTGCYEPTSGVLACEEAITAYRELAERHGATLLPNSKVSDISVKEHQVTVKTDEVTCQANALIVSAGAWSNEVLERLDLELPLTPVRKTFAWFDADEEQYNHQAFPAFSFDTDAGMYYGFPSINQAGLKLGRHDGGESIDPNQSIQPFGEKLEDQTDLTQFLHQYFPNVHELNYGKTCMYTQTPDEKFIIDLHPSYSHVAIAAGFSGHGFKFSSAVGKALSDLLISGKANVDLSPFAINRFN